MTKIFVDKSGAFYRFGELIFLKELTREDVYTTLQELYPDIKFDVLSEVLEFSKCHPYYSAQIIEHFAYDKTYYEAVDGFYNYVNTVLVPQESSYIELQLLKIKEKLNYLETLRFISMDLNPYSEMQMIARQNVLKLIHGLEEMGHIKKIGRANYSLTDPLIGYYLTKY